MAINFVRRGEQNERLPTRLTGCLQHIECAADIHLKIEPRIIYRGRNRDLRREMINFSCALYRLFHQSGVAYVGDGDFQPFGIRGRFA